MGHPKDCVCEDCVEALQLRVAELEAEIAGLLAAIEREGIVVINHPDPMQLQLAPAPGRKPFT